MEKTNREHTFGSFLKEMRINRGLSLRAFAKLIDRSAPYLTDIENDRRNPPEISKLEEIAQKLELTEAQKTEMLDLAGQGRNEVAPDLPDYIKDRNYVAVALRTARDLDVGEKEWLDFVEKIKKEKGIQ